MTGGPTARPLVSVSVVNWNTRDHLERCLRALTEIDHGVEIEVLVVDNHSGDGSAEMVRSRFPDVRLFALDENLGFAGGNNVAIQAAEGDYVVIMNPDVYVAGDTIRRCVEFLEAHPEAGGVGAVLEGLDGRVQSEFFRRFPSRPQILLFYTLLVYLARRVGPLRRRFFEHDVSGTDPQPVDQIPGAFCMVPRSVIEECGPLDPDYFIWFEDVDWSYRITEAGYSLYALPGARAVHAGGASFEGWSLDRRISQFYRSMFRFFAKNGLEGLLRWARRVLIADLVLKEGVVRVLGTLRLKRRSELPTPASLRALRADLRSLVRQHEEGTLVRFSDADHWGRNDPAPSVRTGGFDPHVDVVIVNWNGADYLPRCLAALDAVEGPVRVTVVDNASTDGSRQLLQEDPRDLDVLLLPDNIGYAAAANAGLRRGTGEYALVMNPDVVLHPRHLEVLMARADAAPEIGVAQGKLYSVTRSQFLDGELPTERLDSAAHVMARTRMVFDRGQGQADDPAFDREASVFSTSGAAMFLRRAMLMDLAPDRRFFDEEFFAYKEDIDLCWRSRLLGWDVRYVPEAVAWHVRSWTGTAAPPRDRVPLHARRASWANHWMMMLKNDRLIDVARHLPWVFGWELVRLGYAVLRDPGLLPAYAQAIRRLPDALRKRKSIQARRRVSGREMRPWLSKAVIEVPRGAPGTPAPARPS